MTTDHEIVGKALAFYSEFPTELDLVAASDEPEIVFQTHFSSMLSQQEFVEMENQANKVLDEACEQAKRIIDLCSERVLSDPFVKRTGYLTLPESISQKGSNKYWGCKFRVWSKYSKSMQRERKDCPIQFGFLFTSDNNELSLMSWLWVKGVSREVLISQFNIPDSGFHLNNADLYLSKINVYDVVKSEEKIESLIDRLFRPIESIQPECWKSMLSLAKK